jgi:hypothetical protein
MIGGNLQISETMTMSVFSSIRAKLLQRVLCLLLCVCAWDGPVPILHTHDSLRVIGLLNQHLSSHHCTSVSVHSFGLHWHFAPIRDIYGSGLPNSKSESDGSDIAVFACVCAGLHSSQIQTSMFSAPSMVVMDLEGRRSGTAFRRPSLISGPRSFLVTRLQGVSMQQITLAYVV